MAKSKNPRSKAAKLAAARAKVVADAATVNALVNTRLDYYAWQISPIETREEHAARLAEKYGWKIRTLHQMS